MLKNKVLFLQAFFILIIAAIPALFVVRLYSPTKSFAKSLSRGEEQIFLNPLVAFINEDESNVKFAEKKIAPSYIAIPNINVELPVVAGEIKDNEWMLFEDKVAWLSTSDEPGSGNVILYAHNRDDLFGPLHGLKKGEEIIIEHQGWEYIYEVVDRHKVEPNEIEAVLSDEERLTLYTCDGTFDQRRLVVIARPKV